MRLRIPVLLALCLGASPGFGSNKSHVVFVQDQYSGLREWHLRVATHHCPGVPSTEEWGAHLDFGAFEEANRTITFDVLTELDQKSAFKPHGKATLDTLVDGVAARFTQSAEPFVKHHRSQLGKSVSETIPFALDRNSVVAMSQGKSLQFRLNTRSGYVERCAYAKDLRELKDLEEAARLN